MVIEKPYSGSRGLVLRKLSDCWDEAAQSETKIANASEVSEEIEQ